MHQNIFKLDLKKIDLKSKLENQGQILYIYKLTFVF